MLSATRFDVRLIRRTEPEDLPRPVVELSLDFVALTLRQLLEAAPFGQVLADQPGLAPIRRSP
jgi:hypothetical protein